MIYQYSTQARTLLVQKFEWTGINSCTTQQSIGTYIKLQDNKIENKNYHYLCMLIITKHFTLITLFKFKCSCTGIVLS